MPFPDARLHERRRLVAQLLLRQLSTREIGDALRRQGWAASQATIVRDLAVITDDWRQAAARDLGEHKARELAKLDEVERVAWLQSPPNLEIILRVIAERCKLLRLYNWTPPSPTIEEQIADLGLDPIEIIRQVEDILAGNPEQE